MNDAEKFMKFIYERKCIDWNVRFESDKSVSYVFIYNDSEYKNVQVRTCRDLIDIIPFYIDINFPEYSFINISRLYLPEHNVKAMTRLIDG